MMSKPEEGDGQLNPQTGIFATHAAHISCKIVNMLFYHFTSLIRFLSQMHTTGRLEICLILRVAPYAHNMNMTISLE